MAKLHVNYMGDINIGIASNPNCPIDLLENLAKDENQAKDVYIAIVNNPATPKNIIKSTIEKFDLICRHLAANPNTPIEILRSIDKRDAIVCCSLVENPNITVDILEELANTQDSYVLSKILQNPKVTYKIKKTIFNRLLRWDRSHFTRLIVFFSTNADPSLLSRNYNSSYWLERYAIAQNINTPKKILEKLTKDANVIVRAAALAVNET